MRIPISVKIITLTLSIVISATYLVTRQSSEYLKNEMLQSEDYRNLKETNILAGQVEVTLNTMLEKTSSLASLMLNKDSEEQIKSEFGKNAWLLGLQIYRVNAGAAERVMSRSKDEFLKQNNLAVSFFDDLVARLKFPLLSVAQKNREIQLAEVAPNTPAITVGFPIAKDAQDQVSVFVVAIYKSDLLFSLFGEESERDFYLIDRNGLLLAHQGEADMKIGENISQYPIVKRALNDEAPGRQFPFQDLALHKTYIGAYKKIPEWGLTVFAQTAQDIVFGPAQAAQKKAIYISGMVTSVALFICFLFSFTLTGPLEKLADLIKEIKRGNFNVRARDRVKTRDEVGDLATAFDEMTVGLIERDKVKNILNKFHGSSVAENLIANDVAVGGVRKPVTVFFSDIRSFTKFSEKHTAEEVVAMLNEYFGEMVSIINRTGGVVDKFIGDAIMAVWGVPKSSERDTLNAVHACIEMRKALAQLNEKRIARGQEPILIGMGLHTGDAISGTVGSQDRMEYTVIGDTVNMASRVEAATKAFGTDLLVSENVYEKLKDEIGFELAGSAELKGKAEAMKLFKAIGLKTASGEIERVNTPYSEFAASDAEKVRLTGS